MGPACEEEMTERLAYFPVILPDELVYSAVARFGRDTAQGHLRLNELLFGLKSVVLSYDFPLRLERLAELTHVDARRLLHEHTLLPFHMAFKSADARGRMVDAMLDGELMHWRAANPASLAPRPSHLRFCPWCDAENEEDLGTAFWQRRHQLPTSLVCVRHGEPLRVSGVSTLHKRQRSYRCAGGHGPDAPAMLPKLPAHRMARFVDLTAAGHALLEWSATDGPPPPTDLTARAREAGYGISPSTVRINQERLQADFLEGDAELLTVWPWLGERRRRGVRWIQKLLNETNMSKSPFLHAVLSSFLARSDRGATEAAEGEVDWIGVHHDQCAGVSVTTRGVVTEQQVESEVARVAGELMARRPAVWVNRASLQRGSVLLRTIMDSTRRSAFEPMLAARSETIEQYRLRKVRLAVGALRRSGEEPTLVAVRRLTKIGDLDGLRRWIIFAEGEGDLGTDPGATNSAVDDASG